MLKLLLFPLWLAAALFFAILFIPFLLLKFVFKLAIGLLVLPFALVVGAVGLVLGLLGGLFGLGVGLFFVGLFVLIPLLPIAFVAFLIWGIVRLASPPVVGV
jgi:hypothetical protein